MSGGCFLFAGMDTDAIVSGEVCAFSVMVDHRFANIEDDLSLFLIQQYFDPVLLVTDIRDCGHQVADRLAVHQYLFRADAGLPEGKIHELHGVSIAADSGSDQN